MMAAMLGLAAVLHTSALAFAALKWCGVVYLLYMAWQALRETGALAIERARRDRRAPAGRVIVTGVLINILNPKLSIFFLAFLPQFIAADEPHPLARMLELSGAFMAMTFAVFVVYGLFAAVSATASSPGPRVMAWLRRSFAGGLCRARRQAGVRGAVSSGLRARAKIKKAGRGPPSSKLINSRIESPGGASAPPGLEAVTSSSAFLAFFAFAFFAFFAFLAIVSSQGLMD